MHASVITLKAAPERRYGPETADFDPSAKLCICGAAPLLTEANGGFYLSCPPCWARTHTTGTVRAAKAQWDAMMLVLRALS